MNLVMSVVEKTWEMGRCFDVCSLFKKVTIEEKSGSKGLFQAH